MTIKASKMTIDMMSIFTAWLGLYSISFTFMPLGLVLDWRKRGTAEGFSSVNFVLPLLMTSCWLKHGYMTNDQTNIIINTINIGFFIFYILAFGYYQPKRKYLYGQLVACALTVKAIFIYVGVQDPTLAADVMGSIAAGTQIASLAGGIYEIVSYSQINLSFVIEFIVVFSETCNLNGPYGVCSSSIPIHNVLSHCSVAVIWVTHWKFIHRGTGPQEKPAKKE
uniref:Sugar transporter SWEET n=1 Tax=Heterorhabditis bacteriophora TaxID=37862 RepID=A0A1I7XLD8_HETBA